MEARPENLGDDFWTKYRGLAAKLKKRFLKKPNVAEVADEFRSLAKRLAGDEHRPLAGVCSLAVARCEQTIGNLPCEAEALLNAARLFLAQEQENYDLRLPTFDEHLLNAISYYNMAANVYLEFKQPHLASGVCLEVGNALRAAGKRSEALGYFLQAAEIESKFPLSHLLACQAVVECYVDLGDHEMALNTLTEMGQSLEEQGGEQPAFFEMQSDVEVTSLLILLLLEYPKAHLKTEHRKIMLKFSPDNDDVGSCVHSGSDAENDRRLLLQSLVLAMEMKHFESLKETETQLSKYLNKTQADILHHIVFTSRNRFNLGTS